MTNPQAPQTVIAGTPNAHTGKHQAVLELKRGFTGGDRRGANACSGGH